MMIVVDGQNETDYYYHFDGLGSVIALSDNGGQMTEKYEYDVFGAVTICDSNDSVSSVANPYMFTGRRFDSETGLYYYRARYYYPYIGRFLQVDPIGYADSMNLYIYVGNNPLNWIDPWGLCKEERSRWSDYWDEIFTWPWNIGEYAKKIEREEYPGYPDPFDGDYRHFLAGGMSARICGPIGGAIGIRLFGEASIPELYDPADAAAEWRGHRAAFLHPFTPLRELGKQYTVRPLGPGVRDGVQAIHKEGKKKK